jgi:hypothetical protein
MRKLWSLMALVLLVPGGTSLTGETPPLPRGAKPPQATSAPAAKVSATMQSFTSALGLFQVEFPGTPKQISKPLNLQGGGASTLYQFWVDLDNDNITYMVIYNDYPADYASASPQALLETMRDGVVRNKTLTSDVPIELFGVPGRAFTATDKDGWQYAVHQFLDGSRLYQLIVVNSKERPAGMTEQFMNSFRILKNPATAPAPAPPPAD